MKNKTTAVLLALFLGGFGAHQFYLGNNKRGLVYLLFIWALIPGLIALIDFFILLFMSEDTFNEKYNRSILANAITRSNGSGIHYTEELVKLNELKQKGVITEAEFNFRKEKIMK